MLWLLLKYTELPYEVIAQCTMFVNVNNMGKIMNYDLENVLTLSPPSSSLQPSQDQVFLLKQQERIFLRLPESNVCQK